MYLKADLEDYSHERWKRVIHFLCSFNLGILSRTRCSGIGAFYFAMASFIPQTFFAAQCMLTELVRIHVEEESLLEFVRVF